MTPPIPPCSQVPTGFLCIAASALLAWPLCGQPYSTGFESFPVGNDQLSGNDGWVGTALGQRAHGIDPAGSGGLGRSAFIGRNQPAPSSTFISVSRPVNYDPLAAASAGKTVAEFSAIVGIADSTNGQRDNFYISVYDTGGELLGAVNFDNTQGSFGIYRYDGLNFTRSPVFFNRGRIAELSIRINFETGRWSAELDRLPIFSDELIDFTGKTRTLGTVAAEWQLTDGANAGDNWMLFDEWRISFSPVKEADTPDLSLSVDKSSLTFLWDEEAGYVYRLEHRGEGETWGMLSDSSLGTVATKTRRRIFVLSNPELTPSRARLFRLTRSLPPPLGPLSTDAVPR